MPPPSNTNRTSPKLSATQAQSLLHTLLTAPQSSVANQNNNRNNMSSNQTANPNQPRTQQSPRSPANAPTPPPTQTLHIDASTRLMGHMNNITLPSPSQRTKDIEKVLKAVEPIYGQVAPASNANAGGQSSVEAAATRGKKQNLNLSINAGISIAGSRNTVHFNGQKTPSSSPAAEQGAMGENAQDGEGKVKKEDEEVLPDGGSPR